MIEITTSNSTNVKELLFAFGNFPSEVIFITMTTPTLPPFHQKNPAKKTFATGLRLQSKIQNPRICASRNRGEKFNIQNRCVAPLTPSSLNPLTPRRSSAAFTLIELLAVITVIGILAGLTLGAAGAVRRHGATSTAKAEVAALQAACDRYFADNNTYPIGTASPATVTAPPGGTVLFTNLLGSATLTAVPNSKRYFEPKPAMVFTNSAPNYFIDPWGYAYGYNSDGTNAPLIWSTAGQTTAGGTNKWITSWPKM
jgi:prepilin-type N-terminal cleavage/methylation domain-containing protein